MVAMLRFSPVAATFLAPTKSSISALIEPARPVSSPSGPRA